MLCTTEKLSLIIINKVFYHMYWAKKLYKIFHRENAKIVVCSTSYPQGYTHQGYVGAGTLQKTFSNLDNLRFKFVKPTTGTGTCS